MEHLAKCFNQVFDKSNVKKNVRGRSSLLNTPINAARKTLQEGAESMRSGEVVEERMMLKMTMELFKVGRKERKKKLVIRSSLTVAQVM